MSAERFSTSAILNAIVALDSEISRERDMLDGRELDKVAQEAEEFSFSEMKSAFKEFVTAYEKRREKNAELRPLSEILGAEPDLIAT